MIVRPDSDPISGSGTTNTIAKFTAGKVIGNSSVLDDGTYVSVGATNRLSVRVSDGRTVSGFLQSGLGATFSHVFCTTTPNPTDYAFIVGASGLSTSMLLIYNNGSFEIGKLSSATSKLVGDGVSIFSFSGDSATQKVGINQTGPSAQLMFGAGSTAASSAPWKAVSGSLMTAAEEGAFEFLTDKIYFTIATGTARKEIALNDIALTSGRIVTTTTNGRLTDSSNLTYTTGTVIITNGATSLTLSTTGLTLNNGTYTGVIYPRTGSGNFANVFGNGQFEVATSNGSGMIVGSTAAVPFGIGTNNLLRFYVSSGGDVGIGTGAAASARLHIISTTEQLRVGYDTSNYYSATVGSTGSVVFNAAGTTSSFAFSDRVLKSQGADVASANDLTLGYDGNSFEITGATQINAITTTGWQNGTVITLLFTSNPTVKHNTAGGAGTAVMLLAGAADFTSSAGDTLTLLLSEIGGTQAWREIGRAVI